ncbi:MAG TPA: hypothetical protein VFS89_06890, partial [Nitrosospira sp.]|nr:hypothetical protein [Nitrosospira sp.]
MVRNTPLQSELHTPQSSLRAAIIDAYRRDEARSVDELMGQINLSPVSRNHVQERARRLVTA